MHIDGTAAIVTGGASGLGFATAKLLVENGAKVTIFDMNGEQGLANAAAIGARFSMVNVADDVAVAAALDDAAAVHGAARILVNCAGIAPASRTVGKHHVPHPIDLYRRTIEVNLIGTFTVLSLFAERCAALDDYDGERGVIVNTASVAAYDGQIGQAAYAASKGGIVSMTLPIARDLASYKIRAMAIAPGIFLTPMVAAFSQTVQDALGSQVPHPSRLGQPAEYARLAQHIIENAMLNGEVIRLDGAIRMGPR